MRRLRPKRLVTSAREALVASVSEAEMQRTLRDAAIQATSLYFHDHDARKNDVGFPDTFVGLPKQNLLLVPELKSAFGLKEFWRLLERVEVDPSLLIRHRKALKSHRQRQWIDFLRGQPRIVASIVGPSDLDDVLDLVTQELTTRPRFT